MNKCLLSAALGMALGIYIGYSQEDELDDMCHKSKKAKKRMMKKFHHAADSICDCMER